MLRVACKDLGMEGCDFAVEGEKARKLEYKMLAHIRDEHPELMIGLTDVQYEELEGRIAAGIHPVESDMRAAS